MIRCSRNHKNEYFISVLEKNPYQPTYTFPEEFGGNLELIEDYIRKAVNPDQLNGHDNCENLRVANCLIIDL